MARLSGSEAKSGNRFNAGSWQLDAVRIITAAAFFVVWEAGTRVGALSEFVLPAPSVILRQLWDELLSGKLTMDVQATLVRLFTGFLIAAAIGIPLGILVGRVKIIRWFCDPLISLALPLPQIAFLPIIVLWFGVGDTAKITLIVFSTIFPIVVHTAAGTQAIDKLIVWSAESLGVSRYGFIWQIAVPAAMPQIFTGLQIALPIALITTIVVEMLMGGSGIGSSIINGMRMSDSPELFSGIVMVALVGYALAKIMEFIRKALLTWHQETAA